MSTRSHIIIKGAKPMIYRHCDGYPGKADGSEHPGWYETEDADLALHEDLFFILCDYAPEGFYFGAHNANSSDWGCWPCDEEMEEL